MSFHKTDQFGFLKRPSLAYAFFKEARQLGRTRFPTWRLTNRAYRKKLRKRYLAKCARRRNRASA